MTRTTAQPTNANPTYTKSEMLPAMMYKADSTAAEANKIRKPRIRSGLRRKLPGTIRFTMPTVSPPTRLRGGQSWVSWLYAFDTNAGAVVDSTFLFHVADIDNPALVALFSLNLHKSNAFQ